MKIAMHSNDLCVRGVPTAVFKYSEYLETLYNLEIICLYDKTNRFNDKYGIDKFSNRFTTYGYNNWSEVDSILNKEGVDILYMQKGGDFDNKITYLLPTVIHAVFQMHQPHGNVYAYISEWLSKTMPGNHDFVPYMVEMIQPNDDYKTKFNIPKDAIVFGRHGGYDEFNLNFVHKAIYDVASSNKDIYFMLMNTKPFCEPLDNIIHMDKTIDEQVKSNFINTCDAMIHARHMGESFGLAIAEFLYQDKPVLSFKGGIDQNHIFMLNDKGMWYHDYDSVVDHIINFDRLPKGQYKNLVNQFEPSNVMGKFHDVFIKGVI